MSQLSTQNSDSNQTTNSQNREKIVGFDARNKDSFGHSYICQICMLLLRDPIQLLCGHRFCRSCLNIAELSGIKCVKCNVETAHDKIITDRGCERDMETLPILCFFCDWNGIYKDYKDHLHANHTNLSCQYCSKHLVEKNSLIEHQSECENMIVNCQLKQYGCAEQFLRKDIEKHLLTEKHQSVMLSLLSRTMPHLMNSESHQQIKSSQMDFDLPPTTTSISTMSNDQLNQTIDVLLGSIQVLNDDTQQLSSETLRTQYLLQSTSENLSKLKIAVEETNTFVEGLTPNQQVLQQDLDSLKQEIEDKQAVSYDGTLIWRITNVQKKLADAESEKQTSIYSPPFYSSPNGYKMRARLYLYGDGNARRTHLSLYFVLMRGEHDGILQFPFTYKVTFCLYDQTVERKHIITSFRPDIKSNSFQRPRSEMNIASGIPKFLPLAQIQQDSNPYVHNDTMFIKVMVHFNETPKILLPYILSINPGLSIITQQNMIKQEAEKRTQQPLVVIDTPITSSTTVNS